MTLISPQSVIHLRTVLRSANIILNNLITNNRFVPVRVTVTLGMGGLLNSQARLAINSMNFK